MIRRFISHTLVYGLAGQVSKVAGVLTLPLITRDLTDVDYGIYGIVVAYGSAIEIFTTLGLRVSLMNIFYKTGTRFRMFWSHLYGFLLLWSVPYLLLHVALIYWALPSDAQDPWLVAWLSAGAAFCFGPVSVIGSLYYQLSEKPIIVGAVSSLSGITIVGLNVLFISGMKMGFLGWFWSSFITGAIVCIVYGWLMSFRVGLWPRFSINRRFMTRSLSVSLPTIPHFYSIFLLNSSDRVIMRQLNVSTGDIGRYNIAYTVGNIFQSLAMATGFAITPLMMRCYKNGDESSARNLVFFLQGAFLLGTFLACIWMKELFFLLIKNESLSEMYYLGIIIVMAFNYRPIYYGAVNKLIYLEETKVLWRLTFVPGIINVVINLIFIPIIGYQFAALSTFITFSLMGILGYFQKAYRLSDPLPYYPLWWTLLNVALTAAAFLLRDSDWVLKVAASSVAFVSTVIVGLKFIQLRKKLEQVSTDDTIVT